MVLKANSKAILDNYMSQKKKNATKAYQSVHTEVKAASASRKVSELLRKPEAILYMQEHIDKARQTIVQLTDSEKDDIRLRASQDILDRSHGKAIQQVIQHSQGVTLNLNLSGSTVHLEQKTD